MEIIVQAKACTQRGSKPIFRVWSTSGLPSGSILWQFDFYTKPFLGFGILEDCLQDRFSGILILILILIIIIIILKKLLPLLICNIILFFCNVVIFWTSCSSLPHF
jgi:hypothetical protein